MTKKQALILINHTAGVTSGHDDTFDIITAAAKAGFEPLVFPVIPGTSLVSEKLIIRYGESSDVILCVGGDGTLNHVMSALMCMKEEVRPPIAYVPSGSTNDFARCLGIPETRKKAIKNAIKGKPFRYDVGRMNDRYFNYVAAFGAFSEISYDTDQQLKNVLGYAAYVINAITKLPQNIGYGVEMEIKTEEETYSGRYVFGAVSNSISIGGMKIFGNADISLDDGKMELLLIKSPKNLAELNSIISALATGNPDNPHISFYQAEKVTFHSKEEVSWTLDGEFGGSSCESEINVIPKAVSIMI